MSNMDVRRVLEADEAWTMDRLCSCGHGGLDVEAHLESCWGRRCRAMAGIILGELRVALAQRILDDAITAQNLPAVAAVNAVDAAETVLVTPADALRFPLKERRYERGKNAESLLKTINGCRPHIDGLKRAVTGEVK